MAGISKANTTFLLKNVYTRKVIDQLVEQRGAFFAMIKKSSDMGGNGYFFPVQYGRLVSAGADFTKAQTQATAVSPKGEQFGVTPVTDYALAQITGLFHRAARGGNEKAFRDGLLFATRQAFMTWSHRASWIAYGKGFGKIGTIAATTVLASDTIVLTNKEDALKFDVNQKLVFAATESASALRAGGTLTIKSVDRSAGKIVVTVADMSAVIATLALGDSIFQDGDRQDSATPSRLVGAGFTAWIPQTKPGGADSFFGVNRSVDDRLSGFREPGKSVSKYESMINAAAQVQNDGRKISHFFMHPANFKEVAKEVDGRRFFQMTEVRSRVGISIKAAEILTDFGTVLVVPDAYCEKDSTIGVTLDMWEWKSQGMTPDWLVSPDDGNILTVPTADALEVRVGGDGNFICNDPAGQVVIDYTV